jgi:hypothetical protein
MVLIVYAHKALEHILFFLFHITLFILFYALYYDADSLGSCKLERILNLKGIVYSRDIRRSLNIYIIIFYMGLEIFKFLVEARFMFLQAWSSIFFFRFGFYEADTAALMC